MMAKGKEKWRDREIDGTHREKCQKKENDVKREKIMVEGNT
jgi:hypothetical protein